VHLHIVRWRLPAGPGNWPILRPYSRLPELPGAAHGLALSVREAARGYHRGPTGSAHAFGLLVLNSQNVKAQRTLKELNLPDLKDQDSPFIDPLTRRLPGLKPLFLRPEYSMGI
jgi:hypothetical protein